MKRILLLVALLCLLTGCQGGRSSSSAITGSDESATSSTEVTLQLSAIKQESSWRVTLTATDAVDLYQAAGTITFPAGQYEVAAIEAGGGLGGPQACFFAGKETATGQVDFAYTKRYYGPGVDGEVALVSLLVTPNGEFALADFQLAQAEGECIVRDSSKETLAVSMEVAQ